MKLIKLLEEQVAQLWDVIGYAIYKSLPPVAHESPEKMNNILRSILLGRVQCWVFSEEVELKQLKGVVTTTILVDEASETKSLLIYSLFGYTRLGEEEFNAMYTSLAKWAKANGCNRVIAYSDNDNVISIAEKYGGRPQYSLLSFDL